MVFESQTDQLASEEIIQINLSLGRNRRSKRAAAGSHRSSRFFKISLQIMNAQRDILMRSLKQKSDASEDKIER